MATTLETEAVINQEYGELFDIRALMKTARDPLTKTLRDLKIDDRDMRHAKNYYDYCFNVVGGDINPPWARQMWVALVLFGEICPRCSRKSWINGPDAILNVPKDMETEGMVEHLVLLEHGVCPHCGVRKHELINSGEMKFFQELVLVWGQRCVTADTLILTEDGVEYIGDIGHNKQKNFSPFFKKIHNGEYLEAASQFYVSPHKEPVFKARLKTGGSVNGTSDHPVLTPSGFKRLGDLVVGDYVAESVGNDCWGATLPQYEDAVEYANRVAPAGCKKTLIKATAGVVSIDWFKMLGLWVAEGRGSRISNDSTKINDFVESIFLKHFGKAYVGRLSRYVQVKGGLGASYLSYFLGDLFKGSARQEVPSCVLKAPKPYVSAFLQGLYEGDGGMEGRNITYTTLSRKLAYEVRTLLMNYGIAARLGRGWTWATNGSANQVSKRKYCLVICGRDLEIFRDHIGFFSSRKCRLLDTAIESLNNNVNDVPFQRDKLPPYVTISLLSFVEECTKAIKILPYPQTLNGLSKGAEYGVKRRGTMGKRALLELKPFYWLDSTHAGVGRIMKRIRKNPNDACLTKKRLTLVLDQIEHHFHLLPSKLQHEFKWLRGFENPNIVWSRVVSNKLSSKSFTTYDLTLPTTHRFVGNGIVNHNSGKSTTAAMISSYHLHRFLMFPKFGGLTRDMQSATPLVFSFVSLSFGKAFSVLWEPLINIINTSTWYDEYFKLLDHYGNRYGTEFYNKKKEFMKFFHKNLNLGPTPPAWDALRGDTRALGVVDELGLFKAPANLNAENITGDDGDEIGDEEVDSVEDDKSKRANADEAHKSLTNSLVTVQGVAIKLMKQGVDAVPTGLMLGVSSPTSHQDKVMRLLRESRTEIGSESILGSQLATWMVNPSIDKTHPVIKLAYARNAEKAERDFGANPPRVHSTYIKSNLIETGIFIGPRNTHTLEYDHTDNEVAGKVRKTAVCTQPTIMTLDAGYSNNSFTLCCFYYDFKTGKTHTVTVVELIPTRGRKVNFNKVYLNVILPIARDNHTQILFADRWNSIDLLQRFTMDIPGTKSKQFSPRRKHFDQAKSQITNKNAVLPVPEIALKKVLTDDVTNYRRYFINSPVAHLASQMITVKDVNSLRPPEKGDGYTDDIFRSWILGASLIHDPKVQKILQEAKTKIVNSGAMPAPQFFGRSMGSIGMIGRR